MLRTAIEVIENETTRWNLINYSTKLFLASIFTFSMIITEASAGQWIMHGEENWRFTQNKTGDKCNLEFVGDIENGDLTSLLKSGRLSGSPVICLNSNGGSLAEVLSFVSQIVVDDNQFGTYIKSGDKCISSCAILFMFGKSMGASSPFIDRTMEPGAILGFHSPFLPKSLLNKADGESLYATALAASKLLIDHAYKSETMGGPSLPIELISIILSTPPDKMYYINTIGEMAIMGIGSTTGIVEGMANENGNLMILSDKSPTKMKKIIKNICDSSFILTFKSFYVDKSYNFSTLVNKTADLSHDNNYEFLQFRLNRDQSYDAVVIGPYYQPGWNSAGAMMYCSVHISMLRQGLTYLLNDYSVNFGNWAQIDGDINKINQFESQLKVIKAGLLSIDTPYK